MFQKLESSGKESVEFMESEQATLRDELMETSEKLNDTQAQLQQARYVDMFTKCCRQASTF